LLARSEGGIIIGEKEGGGRKEGGSARGGRKGERGRVLLEGVQDGDDTGRTFEMSGDVMVQAGERREDEEEEKGEGEEKRKHEEWW